MRLIFFFILSVIPTLAVTAGENSQPDQFQQAFMEFLETEVAQDTPGFAVTLVVDGETVLTNTYGVTRVGSSDRINTDTVFRLASVSKTMASAAVGKLVQEGQLQWDARVKDYAESLKLKSPDYQKRLTIKHVLSQQSGLVPHAYTNYIEDNFDYERVMQKMHDVPFVCAPGTCYSYQNVIYSVVGEVVQAVVNQSYDDFVTENLFRPLKMHTASYGLDNFINNKNHATPHVRYRKNKPWKPVKVKENYYKYAPAAGANASINDMNKWLLAQMGKSESVLSADTLAIMHSKHAKTTRSQSHYHGDDWRNIEGTFYGLGWRVFDYANQENFVHHGGWVQGMRAEMIFNSQLQSGMVFLTNSESRLAGDVVPMFLQLYAKYLIISGK